MTLAMTKPAAMALAAALAWIIPTGQAALAQPLAAPEPSETGRFVMMPLGEGFLRLDTRTGAVSLCNLQGGMAVCAPARESALPGAKAEVSKGQPPPVPPAPLAPDQTPWQRGQADLNRAIDKSIETMQLMLRGLRRALRDERATEEERI